MKKILFLLMILACSVANGQNLSFQADLYNGKALDVMSDYTIGLNAAAGISFSDRFFVGIGAGFRMTDALYYSSYSLRRSYSLKYLLPVFLRAKYNILRYKVSPFLMVDAGTTFDVGKSSNKNVGGFFFEPSVGVNIRFNDRLSMYIATGPNVQHTEYTYYGYSSTYKKQGYTTTALLKVGLAF